MAGKAGKKGIRNRYPNGDGERRALKIINEYNFIWNELANTALNHPEMQKNPQAVFKFFDMAQGARAEYIAEVMQVTRQMAYVYMWNLLKAKKITRIKANRYVPYIPAGEEEYEVPEDFKASVSEKG